MDKKQAEFIRDAVEAYGEEAEMYDGYSGRGMFGERTWAVDIPADLDLAAAVARHMRRLSREEFAAAPELDGLRRDQMGKSSVVLY